MHLKWKESNSSESKEWKFFLFYESVGKKFYFEWLVSLSMYDLHVLSDCPWNMWKSNNQYLHSHLSSY